MDKKIFLLIVVDQITKLIFWNRDFFVGPIHVHSLKNYGLIFSLNFGTLVNLIIIAASLSFFCFYYFSRSSKSWMQKIESIFIIAGALSNIIDRLYLGYVRDFLDFGLGFTFNLADVMIILGFVIILLSQTNHEESFGN